MITINGQDEDKRSAEQLANMSNQLAALVIGQFGTGFVTDAMLAAAGIKDIAILSQAADSITTVGAVGNYGTLSAALVALSKKRLLYASTNLKAEIKLLSGFVMAEQVIVDGLDLGWIKITSEDAVVTVTRSALSKSMVIPAFGLSGAITAYPLFGGINNARLPVISVLFDMDTSGTAANRAGFFAADGAQIVIEHGCGCTHAGGQGIYCVQGGRILAAGVNVSGALANAISCFRGAHVVARDGNLSHAGTYGIYADNVSFVDASDADISYSGNMGVWASGASTIGCNFANISNSGNHGVSADNGAIVDAHGATINNCVLRGVSCLGGRISVRSANILNSGSDGINCSNVGHVDAENAVITGSVGKGIYALYGGSINAKGANAQKGATPVSDDIRVLGGGIIVATGATGGLGGVASANLLTASGIIYQ